MTHHKVYDFKVETVKSKVVSALKKRRYESTVTDLVAATGLPNYQVQETVKMVASEFRGQMKVTESGEILYYFPNGFRSRIRGFVPGLKRALKSIGAITAKVLSFLFKVWIVVMLVGYFVLFVALLLIALLASIAGSMSGGSNDNRRSRDSGGGIFGFFFAARVIEFFIQIWLYSTLVRDGRPRVRRPLHRAVFSYVFGAGDPNSAWGEDERKAVIRYIQSNKGVITLEEIMVLTGQDVDQAQQTVNEYLLEFGGDPEVTDDGTLYYRFPDLMRSRDLPSEPVTRSTAKKRLYSFSGNPRATNRWITFFNAFNLVFGGYFLYYSLAVPVIQKGDGLAYLYLLTSVLVSRFLGLDPTTIIPIVLGAIPVAFSVLFFLVPFLRRLSEKRKNESIKKSNLLKRIYDRIMQNPMLVDPRKIEPTAADETPSAWESFRDKAVKQFAGAKEADVEATDDGGYVYRLKELEREQADIAKLRNSIDIASYNIGKTIYDSGE